MSENGTDWGTKRGNEVFHMWLFDEVQGKMIATMPYGENKLIALQYQWSGQAEDPINAEPKVVRFPLDNIDKMREYILSSVFSTTPYKINKYSIPPYNLCLKSSDNEGNDMKVEV